MNEFRKTTHLSEILEESSLRPIIIFKYSSECGTSSSLAKKLEDSIRDETINHLIYLVIVQTHKALCGKIETMFEIKHESPQIIILNKGKVTYTAHHKNIKIENFKYN